MDFKRILKFLGLTLLLMTSNFTIAAEARFQKTSENYADFSWIQMSHVCLRVDKETMDAIAEFSFWKQFANFIPPGPLLDSVTAYVDGKSNFIEFSLIQETPKVQFNNEIAFSMPLKGGAQFIYEAFQDHGRKTGTLETTMAYSNPNEWPADSAWITTEKTNYEQTNGLIFFGIEWGATFFTETKPFFADLGENDVSTQRLLSSTYRPDLLLNRVEEITLNLDETHRIQFVEVAKALRFTINGGNEIISPDGVVYKILSPRRDGRMISKIRMSLNGDLPTVRSYKIGQLTLELGVDEHQLKFATLGF